MTDQNIPNDPGGSAWTGKPFSATPKASIRKDLPDPAKNTSPKAPVPVDTYYKKYNEMMARSKSPDESPQDESVIENGSVKIEFKDEPEDRTKTYLKYLIEDGTGLFLTQAPNDFVLSERVFRDTAMKAKNGKKIAEIINGGKVIGYGIKPEPPEYRL